MVQQSDSLWKIERSLDMKEISKEIKEASKVTSEEWKEWTKTVWSIANTSDVIHPAVFPEEIPYRLIRMYSFIEEKVLDPFSGMATTGKAALRCGREYVGFETNPIFQGESIRRMNEYIDLQHIEEPIYSILNQSSCDMGCIENDSVGLVVTSPPYWNKADYGDYMILPLEEKRESKKMRVYQLG